MKLHDQHMHSSFSTDSEEDLRNYYILAQKEGIKYVCTCEHFDYLTVIDGSTWAADYDELMKYHQALILEFPDITPLLGIELGYKKIALPEMKRLTSTYPFDIVQLSIHDNDEKKCDYYFSDAFKNNIEESMNEYFDLMIEGINAFDNFDVLSHIDYGFKTLKMMHPSYEFKMFEEKITKVLKLCIEKGKALEINTKVNEVIEEIDKDNRHLNYLLNLYKRLNGKKLTISSDAHSVSRYRSSFSRYLKIIKDNGFDEVVYFIKRKEYKFKV